MRFFLTLPLFLCLSCSTLVPVPDVPQEVATLDPEKAWASVLETYVDDQGRVNFKALQKNPGKLRRYVQWIAKNGPNTQPQQYASSWAKLAYYINSYNALSMYNVIDSGIPESLGGLKKVRFFYFKKFTIDGQVLSLYAYENDIIRRLGEERVHFALNCMSAGCPRLPRRPFLAATLDQELDNQARFFFSEQRNVQVDPEKKVVRLSEILDFFPEDFKKKAATPVVYANRYRKEKLPEDYQIKFIPYDWTINAQPVEKLAHQD